MAVPRYSFTREEVQVVNAEVVYTEEVGYQNNSRHKERSIKILPSYTIIGTPEWNHKGGNDKCVFGKTTNSPCANFCCLSGITDYSDIERIEETISHLCFFTNAKS